MGVYSIEALKSFYKTHFKGRDIEDTPTIQELIKRKTKEEVNMTIESIEKRMIKFYEYKEHIASKIYQDTLYLKNNNYMEKEKANKVYDLLVSIGGADENLRNTFLYHHCIEKCEEWRFVGKLGYGGKYRSKKNRVDYYSEDISPEREQVVKELNNKLSKI